MRTKPGLGDLQGGKMRDLSTLLLLLLLGGIAMAQSGGTFQITQSSIASGGAQNVAGGSIVLEDTAGQPMTARSTGGTFSISGGFFPLPQLAPTAASVGISGRIVAAAGNGIKDVRVILVHASSGETRQALTSPFGYYSFGNITVGETYLLTVSSKRYSFDPATRVVTLVDEISDLDWVALPE